MKPLPQSIILRVVCCIEVELHPRCSASAVQNSNMNCGPLSEVTSDGVPNQATQDMMNTLATSADVVEDRGIASGHLIVLHTTVRR